MEQPGQENGPRRPTAFGRRRETKSEKRLYLALFLGAIVLGGAYSGGRAIVGYMVTYAPYSWDQTLGDIAKDSFLADAEQCTNPKLLGAVREIVRNLASGLEKEYQDIQVYVLNDAQVNAFALPGGHVFVLTGLLKTLNSTEELIGVLVTSWAMWSSDMASSALLKARGLTSSLRNYLGILRG